MTDKKQPTEIIADEDLDSVQAAGTAVGNPGKKGGIAVADSSDRSGVTKKDGEKGVLSSLQTG